MAPPPGPPGPPAPLPAADPITDLSRAYLPRHDFAERHERILAAPPPAVLDAVERMDVGDDPAIAALMRLRRLPERLVGRLRGRAKAETGADETGAPARPRAFGLHSFTRLERTGDALAYGLVGRFWRLDFGLEPIADAAAFRAFDRPGIARLVMSYETAPLPDGRTRLVTRTRIACPDAASRRRMRLYWLVIRLGSGFIRRRLLKGLEKKIRATPPAGA